MSSTDVLVIGAGIAGLTVAHTLRGSAAARSVLVLEEGAHPGGKVATEVRDGYTFDLGPSQFSRRAPDTAALLDELGLTDRVTVAGPAAREVYVVRGERVLPIPTSPAAAVTSRLLSPLAKLRILLEPLLAGSAPAEETVYAFAARHFGHEFARVVVAAAALGTTAADIRDTSLDAAFPRVRQLEATVGRSGLLGAALKAVRQQQPGTGPPLASFSPGGVAVLADALSASLGDVVRCGATVIGLRPGSQRRYEVSTGSGESYHADVVVLAVPSYAAAPLLARLAPDAAGAANGIPFVGVRVVGLGYRLADLSSPVRGSGILAPHRPGRRVFAVAPVSNVFAGHAPAGHQLLRVFTGGQHDPEMLRLPLDQALDVIRADLRRLLGLTASPCFVTEAQWPQGIPRYRLGHLARVRAIEAALADHPGLFITGNFLYGAGLDATIRHARALAQRVLHHPMPAPRRRSIR
jgi:oxygen-dependent protoporphyrinogen oxidase